MILFSHNNFRFVYLGGVGVRSDERAPRCPCSCCPVGSDCGRVLPWQGGTGCAAVYWQHLQVRTVPTMQTFVWCALLFAWWLISQRSKCTCKKEKISKWHSVSVMMISHWGEVLIYMHSTCMCTVCNAHFGGVFQIAFYCVDICHMAYRHSLVRVVFCALLLVAVMSLWWD